MAAVGTAKDKTMVATTIVNVLFLVFIVHLCFVCIHGSVFDNPWLSVPVF
jgi:hypothetical protein